MGEFSNIFMEWAENPYFYPIVNTVVGIILGVLAICLIPIILDLVLGVLSIISAALAPLLPALPVIALIVAIFILPESKATLLSDMANVILSIGM